MISKAIHYKMIKACTLLWLALLNAYYVAGSVQKTCGKLLKYYLLCREHWTCWKNLTPKSDELMRFCKTQVVYIFSFMLQKEIN